VLVLLKFNTVLYFVTAEAVVGSTTWLGRGLSCVCAQSRESDARPSFDLTPSQALRLRSNELKLERQLENTKAEISSFKCAIIFLYQRACDLHFQDELITCLFNYICLLPYVFKSNCLDYNAHT
ncbi:hypothetical protein ERO13_D05G319900v2, partial [Gossypium hirsutum]